MKDKYFYVILILALVYIMNSLSSDSHSNIYAGNESEPRQSLGTLALSSDNPVLAIVDDHEIKLDDIRDKEMTDIMRQLYVAMNGRVTQKIVELSKTDPTLKTQMSAIKVSEDEVNAFYKKNNLQDRGSIAELSYRIYTHLIDVKSNTIANAFINEKKSKNEVKINYSEPPIWEISTPVNDAIGTHPKSGSIAIVEYSDFQCPFCFRVQNTISNIKKQFPKITFYYKHFPLSFHEEADEAAIASECADQENEFEEYKTVLFKNQKNQFESDLIRYASEIGIKDMDQFKNCLKSVELRNKVNRHIQEGSEIGITGTPGFVIGKYDAEKQTVTGQLVTGAAPESNFVQVIKQYVQ